jgi:translation initiation factor 6
MHVLTLDALGNPNVGLYAYATDDYCLIGPELQEYKEEIADALQVPVHIHTIAGTGLLGVFLAGNSKTLLVPQIAFDHEIAALQEYSDVKIFETLHTALGNNLVINDHGCLAGPMFEEEEHEVLNKLLDIPVRQFAIADIEVVGSAIVINSFGGVIHRDANQFEIDMAQDTLKLTELYPGTANLGSPYVRSGIFANTHGFVIGKNSGGPEITNADEALGFLQ